MGKYNFSIIIPTYNRPQVLQKTLDCLERQETDIPFEVIVVDDCSTLPLPDLGFGKGKRAVWKFLRNGRNLGRAVTRNRGIREAKGEYVLMIDDDIWASPGLLRAHCEAQERIGGGVVVGSMPIAQEVQKDIWNQFYRHWTDELHVQMATYKYDLPYNFFFTGNVSIPRSLLEKVGLFDESFSGYSGEDTELGYRLKISHVPFIYEPLAVGMHYNVETLDSILRKRRQMGAASFHIVRRHPELARELSIAGLLAPGKAYYQVFLSPMFLHIGRMGCRFMAALEFETLCSRFLPILCKAYSGLGLKEAKSEK